MSTIIDENIKYIKDKLAEKNKITKFKINSTHDINLKQFINLKNKLSFSLTNDADIMFDNIVSKIDQNKLYSEFYFSNLYFKNLSKDIDNLSLALDKKSEFLNYMLEYKKFIDIGFNEYNGKLINILIDDKNKEYIVNNETNSKNNNDIFFIENKTENILSLSLLNNFQTRDFIRENLSIVFNEDIKKTSTIRNISQNFINIIQNSSFLLPNSYLTLINSEQEYSEFTQLRNFTNKKLNNQNNSSFNFINLNSLDNDISSFNLEKILEKSSTLTQEEKTKLQINLNIIEQGMSPVSDSQNINTEFTITKYIDDSFNLTSFKRQKWYNTTKLSVIDFIDFEKVFYDKNYKFFDISLLFETADTDLIRNPLIINTRSIDVTTISDQHLFSINSYGGLTNRITGNPASINPTITQFLDIVYSKNSEELSPFCESIWSSLLKLKNNDNFIINKKIFEDIQEEDKKLLFACETKNNYFYIDNNTEDYKKVQIEEFDDTTDYKLSTLSDNKQKDFFDKCIESLNFAIKDYRKFKNKNNKFNTFIKNYINEINKKVTQSNNNIILALGQKNLSLFDKQKDNFISKTINEKAYTYNDFNISNSDEDIISTAYFIQNFNNQFKNKKLDFSKEDFFEYIKNISSDSIFKNTSILNEHIIKNISKIFYAGNSEYFYDTSSSYDKLFSTFNTNSTNENINLEISKLILAFALCDLKNIELNFLNTEDIETRKSDIKILNSLLKFDMINENIFSSNNISYQKAYFIINNCALKHVQQKLKHTQKTFCLKNVIGSNNGASCSFLFPYRKLNYFSTYKATQLGLDASRTKNTIIFNQRKLDYKKFYEKTKSLINYTNNGYELKEIGDTIISYSLWNDDIDTKKILEKKLEKSLTYKEKTEYLNKNEVSFYKQDSEDLPDGSLLTFTEDFTNLYIEEVNSLLPYPNLNDYFDLNFYIKNDIFINKNKKDTLIYHITNTVKNLINSLDENISSIKDIQTAIKYIDSNLDLQKIVKEIIKVYCSYYNSRFEIYTDTLFKTTFYTEEGRKSINLTMKGPEIFPADYNILSEQFEYRYYSKNQITPRDFSINLVNNSKDQIVEDNNSNFNFKINSMNFDIKFSSIGPEDNNLTNSNIQNAALKRESTNWIYNNINIDKRKLLFKIINILTNNRDMQNKTNYSINNFLSKIDNINTAESSNLVNFYSENVLKESNMTNFAKNINITRNVINLNDITEAFSLDFLLGYILHTEKIELLNNEDETGNKQSIENFNRYFQILNDENELKNIYDIFGNDFYKNILAKRFYFYNKKREELIDQVGDVVDIEEAFKNINVFSDFGNLYKNINEFNLFGEDTNSLATLQFNLKYNDIKSYNSRSIFVIKIDVINHRQPFQLYNTIEFYYSPLLHNNFDLNRDNIGFFDIEEKITSRFKIADIPFVRKYFFDILKTKTSINKNTDSELISIAENIIRTNYLSKYISYLKNNVITNENSKEGFKKENYNNLVIKKESLDMFKSIKQIDLNNILEDFSIEDVESNELVENLFILNSKNSSNKSDIVVNEFNNIFTDIDCINLVNIPLDYDILNIGITQEMIIKNGDKSAFDSLFEQNNYTFLIKIEEIL